MQKFPGAGAHCFDDELRIADHRGHEKPALRESPIQDLQRLERCLRLVHVHDDHVGIGFNESPARSIASQGTVLCHFQLHASHTRCLREGSQRLASFGLRSENSNGDVGQASLHVYRVIYEPGTRTSRTGMLYGAASCVTRGP
ncbi:MAG: hypothetical protein DMG13_18790, partial [Acidobacteria bacterium]